MKKALSFPGIQANLREWSPLRGVDEKIMNGDVQSKRSIKVTGVFLSRNLTQYANPDAKSIRHLPPAND
jgi:hypothetical protein